MARVFSNYSGYINNVLIPFLDKLEWLSKKNLDYKDWKLVLTLKKRVAFIRSRERSYLGYNE